MLDPTATVTPPTSETPELKIEIPTFTLKFDNPLDHVKAMLVSDRRYPTGEGLSVSVDLCVEVNGTEANPFGADPDNPKLGSGAIALIDNTTGVVLNFEVSNRRILALREHFKVKSPTGKDSTLPMIDPLLTNMTIEPGSWHRYEIRYQPGEDGWLEAAPDYAQWLVDAGSFAKSIGSPPSTSPRLQSFYPLGSASSWPFLPCWTIFPTGGEALCRDSIPNTSTHSLDKVSRLVGAI